MVDSLQALLDELRTADRQERIELLIDLARGLPPLPERLLAARDPAHRVSECQSPVYLFVEVDDDSQARLFAEVPAESPTVRGFVALLVDGLDRHPVSEILDVPDDLVARAGVAEVLGMQRVSGLNGVVRRLKQMAGLAIAGRGAPIETRSSPPSILAETHHARRHQPRSGSRPSSAPVRD